MKVKGISKELNLCWSKTEKSLFFFFFCNILLGVEGKEEI